MIQFSHFFLIALASAAVFKSQFRPYLHCAQQLRKGIHNDTNFALRYFEVREIQKTAGPVTTKYEYHLFRILSERFSSKLLIRIDLLKLSNFSEFVFKASNELVMDYGYNRQYEGLEFSFPAEFDSLFNGFGLKDFHDLVKDKDFDDASRYMHELAFEVFTDESMLRGMVLAIALQLYEEALKVIYRYRVDVPELSNLCEVSGSKSSPTSLIIRRLTLLLGHWEKLHEFDFRTAYPILASSQLILQYSLLISLLLENRDLTDRIIEYSLVFDQTVLLNLNEFQPIRTAEKKLGDVDIKAHVVPSSWTHQTNLITATSEGRRIILVTPSLKADLNLMMKEFLAKNVQMNTS